MSIYYELISLPEKRKSGILDAYRWIFKTAQKGMNHMHNLRKTIRYGILSVLGVIVMGICMRYAIKINFPNKGFPRKGQILPAPGRNVTVGD